MPAAWYEDERMLITVADVLRLQGEQAEKQNRRAERSGRSGR